MAAVRPFHYTVTIVNTVLETPTGFQPWQLRLPSFEGPLDVLLRLVERSQLKVTDVSLMSVTDQFLAYVAELDDRDPGVLAEFSSVGSRLVVLKSRMLLPKPVFEDDESVGDLAKELIEYQTFKRMAGLLAERDALGEGAYPNGMGVRAETGFVEMPLANHQPSQLIRALRRRLHVSPPPPLIVTARKLVSLHEMAARVLQGVRNGSSTSFRTVTQGCADYHEVRTAFLAVLVLARRNVVLVEQRELFGDIAILPAESVVASDAFLVGLVEESGGI